MRNACRYSWSSWLKSFLLIVDGTGNRGSGELAIPANVTLARLPAHSPELNPQENIWDEIRENIFKNYAAKSMDEVCEMLVEGSIYSERNPELVKSMTSFPYILQVQFDMELVSAAVRQKCSMLISNNRRTRARQKSYRRYHDRVMGSVFERTLKSESWA